MAELEYRREARKVVARFSTGEVKHTEFLEYVWVDKDATPPQDVVYCPVSTKSEFANESNIRRKAV